MAEDKMRQVTISKSGELKDEQADGLVLCPLLQRANGQRLYCSTHCAWFSEDSNVAKCQSTVIGQIMAQEV